MGALEQLKDHRRKVHERESKVDRLFVSAKNNRDHFEHELKEEREEREKIREFTKDLKAIIEEETEADEAGVGLKSEEWQQRKEDRLDELADMFDASEARSDRLAKKLLEEKHEIHDLAKRDEALEKRLERMGLRIAKLKKKEGQLTKDFYVWEFDCKDGTSIMEFCAYMIDDLKAYCERHLQPLRNAFDRVVGINSALRHAAYNRLIGGATQSYHVYELRKKFPAVDHIVQGIAASVVQKWHEAHNPFDGMGFYSGFTHGDDRGYHSRWWGIA